MLRGCGLQARVLRPSQCAAAIEDKDLAGNECRMHKKQDRVGNFGGLSGAAQRREFDELRLPFRRITTPAFETECATYAGHPSKPPVSAKLMIVPLDRRRSGAAACAQKKGAFRFASSEASQTSSVVEI